MFALSLFLMAFPTLLIGLLPSYAMLGMIAPLLFLFAGYFRAFRLAVKCRGHGSFAPSTSGATAWGLLAAS